MRVQVKGGRSRNVNFWIFFLKRVVGMGVQCPGVMVFRASKNIICFCKFPGSLFSMDRLRKLTFCEVHPK